MRQVKKLWTINSDYPITAVGDHPGELKAVSKERKIPFECKNFCTQDELPLLLDHFFELGKQIPDRWGLRMVGFQLEKFLEAFDRHFIISEI
jgi:hypothetical protein